MKGMFKLAITTGNFNRLHYPDCKSESHTKETCLLFYFLSDTCISADKYWNTIPFVYPINGYFYRATSHARIHDLQMKKQDTKMNHNHFLNKSFKLSIR